MQPELVSQTPYSEPPGVRGSQKQFEEQPPTPPSLLGSLQMGPRYDVISVSVAVSVEVVVVYAVRVDVVSSVTTTGLA